MLGPLFNKMLTCGSQEMRTLMVLQQRALGKTFKRGLFFITGLKIPELNALRDGSAERIDAVSTLSQFWLHLYR